MVHIAALARIGFLIRKELLDLLKEPSARVLLIAPALIQGLLFGYGATYDLTHAPYAVLDQSRGEASSELLRRLDGTGVFQRQATLSNAKDIAHATPQLNVLQRVGGSVGTALLATILQAQLTDLGGGSAGGAKVGEGSMDASKLPPQALDAIGGAFGDTFVWVMVCTAIAIIPAALLMREERRTRRAKALAAAVDAEVREEAAVAASELEHA